MRRRRRKASSVSRKSRLRRGRIVDLLLLLSIGGALIR